MVDFPPEDTLQGALRETVRKWMLDDGWKLTPSNPDGFAWSLVCDDSQRIIAVGQLQNRADQLWIEASVTISEDLGTRIAAMADRDRQDFLWDMRFRLLEAKYDFSGVDFPTPAITIRQVAYQNGLNKDVFMQRAREVRNGVALIQWLIQKRFN